MNRSFLINNFYKKVFIVPKIPTLIICFYCRYLYYRKLFYLAFRYFKESNESRTKKGKPKILKLGSIHWPADDKFLIHVFNLVNKTKKNISLEYTNAHLPNILYKNIKKFIKTYVYKEWSSDLTNSKHSNSIAWYMKLVKKTGHICRQSALLLNKI